MVLRILRDEMRRLSFQRTLRRRPGTHLDAVRETPEIPVLACPRCQRAGAGWVHLRMCTTCGAVGCCDTSFGRHAAAHFAETGHPVMRSIEPGEAWGWCYADQAYLTNPATA